MVKILSQLFSHPRDISFLPNLKQDEPSVIKRIFRVMVDAARGFVNDDCYSKASALTFYSLLSIVPLLAVLFGIAKGFGFERPLELEIRDKFFEQKEITEKLIEFAYSWLNNVKGGVIAGVGTAVLLWSVLGLLNNIETALNAIWKTRNSRSYTRKLSDFLATLVICPIFFVAVSSLNVFITTHITETAQSNVLVEAVSPYILFILKFFPYFLSWLLFTFVYLFMPNTRVYASAAILAGIIGGTFFQLWQWAYIKFQIGVASYGAIYGSFAALPLFLVWLQISWIIFLAGAEIAVEIENDLFIPLRKPRPLGIKAAALFITYRCVEAFTKSKPPITDHQLAQELGMSLNHVQILLEALQNERILSEVSAESDKTAGYQPARAIQTITMKRVCDAIDASNDIPACYDDSQEMDRIKEYLEDTSKLLAEPSHNPVLYSIDQNKKG